MSDFDELRLRFWLRVDTSGECWLWMGSRLPKGYGSYKFRGTTWRAPRLSWVLHNGPIPEGAHVLHRCDNPPCVRPDHLWLGTNADNVRDRETKHRRTAPRGVSNGRAKLTQEQVDEIRRLYRLGARDVGQSGLGRCLGLTHRAIADIVNRRSYV